MTDRFYGIRYEVFGKVQGVWFRKTTQEMADKLATDALKKFPLKPMDIRKFFQ